MKKVIGIIISSIGGIMLAVMATCWNLFVWANIYIGFFNIHQRYIHGNIRMEYGGSEHIWMLILTILAVEIYALGSLVGDINPMKTLFEKYSRKRATALSFRVLRRNLRYDYCSYYFALS